MNYGIPYMGSKTDIVASIALNLPPADNFYDLFGGGFSVSHYMLKHAAHKYKTVHYNEIVPSTVELVKRAIIGDFNYEKFKPEWISREAFSARNAEAYVRILWSFGNSQDSYLFSAQIEPYKKSMHMAVVFGEFDALAEEVFKFDAWPPEVQTVKAKRYYLRQIIEHYRKTKIPKILLQFLKEERLQQLERLERLEQLQQLQQLERLERLRFYSLDYRQVEILPNSIVYCDIPYKGTAEYSVSFNHREFFDWGASRDFPVFVSEYGIDDSRFECIYAVGRSVKLSGKGSSKEGSAKREKLFWNRK